MLGGQATDRTGKIMSYSRGYYHHVLFNWCRCKVEQVAQIITDDFNRLHNYFLMLMILEGIKKNNNKIT